ncbi:MAG: tetratricopeptide repeat protein [Verrucomicrobia bacterium]|nr:tetratricopeptide repeat protein [Verrucomicrobiota bacterium]
MKFRPLPRRFVLALLTSACAFCVSSAQAQTASAEEASNAALQLMNEGKLPDAAAAFESVLKNYPTSMGVSDTQYRLATLYFILGDYEKSRALIQKLLAPPTPADITELACGLLPQMLAAKSAREKTEADRKAGFEAAIKEFDAFVQKYPTSALVETVTYGKALSSFQIAKYDEVSAALRSNLKRFPNSETILESQYLLSICLMTQGFLAAQETPGVINPKADAAFGEAQRLLNDIIQRRSDIALLNDAQFQLGELLVNQALFAPEASRSALYEKALEAYRSLFPKATTVAAQEVRIKNLRDRRLAALASKNLAQMKSLEGLLEHEISKLSAVKAKGDLTISAQIKVGQLFFHKDAYDEARVVFRQMQPFAEDAEQKKNLLYYLTLSYAQQSRAIPSEARQKLVGKAVARYEEFQKNYKGDLLADSLPYTIGSLFLTTAPQKALEYFQQGIQIYPEGRLLNDTLIAQANACIQLKQFDKALATFQAFLKENPKRELAAAAESGIATILKDTGKTEEALAQYQKLRAAYAGTPQAENAAFWVGQIRLQKGDLEAAITDLSAFLKDYPKSELFPGAKYSLAQAYARKKEVATALQLFKEIAEAFPKSEAAPYAFFEQANLLPGEEKAGERNALMKEFIRRYPEHEKLFFAYNTLAQAEIAKGHTAEAVAVLTEMAEKRPTDPQTASALLTIVSLWNQQANTLGRYFALNEAQRGQWNAALTNALAAAEKIIHAYPESPQLPLAMQYLLAGQKLLEGAKLKTDEEITQYFQGLAAQFEAKPQTKSKILFTLASFTYEKDKSKALEQMQAAYNPQLVYAAADMDLYASVLLEKGKIDEAVKVYQKLAVDFPNPDPAAPEKAPLQIQEAQAIALFGTAKALQSRGQIAQAAEKFDAFKKLYPRSPAPKILEANYGIAVAAHQQNQDDKAIPLLIQVFRAPTAAVSLRANAMLLYAKIQEAKGETLPAIDQYLKIALFYDSVPTAAAEALWCGGQLLEKQASALPASSQNPKEVTRATQLKKAVKAYADLITKYPTSPHIKEARARHAALESPSK